MSPDSGACLTNPQPCPWYPGKREQRKGENKSLASFLNAPKITSAVRIKISFWVPSRFVFCHQKCGKYTQGHLGNLQAAPKGRRARSHLLFAECQMGPDGAAIFPGSRGGKTLAATSSVIFQVAHTRSAPARLSPYNQCCLPVKLGTAPSRVLPCTGVGWEHLPATIWGSGCCNPSSSSSLPVHAELLPEISEQVLWWGDSVSLANMLPPLKTAPCPFFAVSVSTCLAPHTVGFSRSQHLPSV